MSDENTNSLISAHNSSSSSGPAPAEVVSADRSESSSEFATRRPEEEEQPADSQQTQSLSDHLAEIDADSREQREAEKWGRQNVSELADILGADAEDLDHLPKSILAFPAAIIAKVLDDLDMTLADLDDRYKVDILQTALKEEQAEQDELAAVRESLESEDAQDTDEDDSDEDTEGENESEETPEQTEEEAKPEDATEKPTSLADMTPEQYAQMEKHLGDVYQTAMKVNDPTYVEYAGAALAEVLDIAEEHRPKFQAAAKVLTTMGESMLQTRVPDLARNAVFEVLPQMLENVLPGAAALFREAQIANTWHSVLESPEFADLGLPRHNTPEFHAAAEKIYAQNPWLADLDPVGPDGKQLPIAEALRIKATIAARLLAGQRISPKAIAQQVADAVQQVKRNAERSTRRVSAGRALKGGRSTGQFAERKEYLTLMDAYRAGGHGSSFSGDGE